MDTLDTYRVIIREVLQEYLKLQYAYGDIQNELIIDCEADRYMIVSIGWQGAKRIHGCLIHIDIIEDKVWIQRDGTETGIANDLLAKGIPKDHIVIGFHDPEVRRHTDFAAA